MGGVREREVVRENSRGCGVFWTNPGLSQAQDTKSRLRSNGQNEVCWQLTDSSRDPEKMTEVQQKRCSSDRMQFSKIALPSACDVRALLRENKNVLETYYRLPYSAWEVRKNTFTWDYIFLYLWNKLLYSWKQYFIVLLNKILVSWCVLGVLAQYGFPVAQMVEHGVSNAKIMGSIPRESKSW